MADVAAADESATRSVMLGRSMSPHLAGAQKMCGRKMSRPVRYLIAAVACILIMLPLMPYMPSFTHCSMYVPRQSTKIAATNGKLAISSPGGGQQQPAPMTGPNPATSTVVDPALKIAVATLAQAQDQTAAVKAELALAKSELNALQSNKLKAAQVADIPPPPPSLFPELSPEFWLLYRRYSNIEPQRSTLDKLLLQGELPTCGGGERPISLIIEWFQYPETLMKRLSGTEMAANIDHKPGMDRRISPDMFVGRNAEILAVLQMNLLHPLLTSIHVRVETQDEANTARRKLYDPCHKLVLSVEQSSFLQPDGRVTNNRTFSHMLAYANNHLPAYSFFILTHSDIVLGEGLHRMAESKTDWNNTLSMLSRWGLPVPECAQNRDGQIGPEDQCINYQGSHDTTLAQTPVKQQLLDSTRFSRAQLGSENLFMAKAVNAGYRVTNPCKNVKTYHSHCSSLRIDHSYGERLNRAGQSHTVGGSDL